MPQQSTLLADLPSREVLLSRMLGSMMSPISGLAIVLDQIAKKGENAPSNRSLTKYKILTGGSNNV